MGVGGCKSGKLNPPPSEENIEKSADYVLTTKAQAREQTILLFLNRNYEGLENLIRQSSASRSRMSDGSWLLAAQAEAFDVDALRSNEYELEERFADWEKSQPQSQLRAACAARYWRLASNSGPTPEYRLAKARLRGTALASISGDTTGAALAVEKIMRLTSREEDRGMALAFYASASAQLPGYEPLVEGYAGWLGGFAPAEVGPWLGAECDKIGGVDGDELYARVAVSRSRSGGDWIAQRALDWPRIQRGFWSLQRRWPGATDALDQLAKAAFVCKDREVARRALESVKTTERSVWSNNYGYYLNVRRFAGLERASELKPVAEVKPSRDQRLVSAAYSPDGARLAIGGARGELSLWSLPDLKLVWSDTNPHWISSLAYSSDGRWLAMAGGNFYDRKKGGNVRVWDMKTMTVAVTLDNLPEVMNAAAFSPSGDILWVGGGRNQAQLAYWRVGDARITLLPIEDGPSGAIQDLVVGDGKVYLAASRQLWSLEHGEAGDVFKQLHEGNANYSSIALSPDHKRLALGTWMKIAAWDTPAQVEVYQTAGEFTEPVVMPARGTRIERIIFSPDGARLLVASNASEVRMWIDGGKGAPSTFYADGWTIDAMAVSPDSEQAVTIATSGVVRLWPLGRER